MHTPEFESDENFLIYHWQYIQCDTIKTGSLYHEIFTIDTPNLMAVCYKKAPHCYKKKVIVFVYKIYRSFQFLQC